MHAVNNEMTQILEENIRSMEPEIPKLKAEVANAKKMERAAVAVAGELFANMYLYTCSYFLVMPMNHQVL